MQCRVVRSSTGVLRSVVATRTAIAAGACEIDAAPGEVFARDGCRWRTYRSGTPRHIRDKKRRARWKEIRQALEWATRFDPLRKARLSVRQTLRMNGWPIEENQAITEGVTVPFAMKHKYLAFEICLPSDYIEGTPVLKPEVQERHLLIRRKGWKLVVVNQRAWEKRSLLPHDQHLARRDLIIDLILRQMPLEDRRTTENVGAR